MKKDKLIPKRRFKESKNDGDWEQRKFSSMVNLRRGLTYKPNDVRNKGVIVLRSSNINEDKFILNEDDVFVHEKAVNIDFIKENDILITSANGSSHLVGKHALVEKMPTKAVHGGFMLAASANNPFFINSLMSTQWYSRFIKTYIAGGNGAIGNLRRSDLEEQIVLVPNELEQEKIGSFFKQLDKLITLHQRKLEKLKNLKLAYLSKMFPREGEKYPELRFDGFIDAWEQRKLGEVVNIRSGRDYKHLSEGEIPVYGTGGYMLSVNEALSYKEDAIGIGRKGTIDKPYILRAPFWTVDTLFYAVPETNNDLDFIYNIFQNINWKQKDESTGVPSLSKTAISDIDVLVSDYKEQKIIGNFFKQLDNLITLHQRKLEKLKNIKKAFLNEMFV